MSSRGFNNMPKGPPVPRRPAPIPAVPAPALVGDTEKFRLERRRRREQQYKRLYGGIYKIQHEEHHVFFPYIPQPWLNQFNIDLVVEDGLRSATTKARQMFCTSNFGIILLDDFIWTPGSVSLVHNMKQEEAKATLETRIVAPFRETMPDLVNSKNIYIAHFHMEYRRPAGSGGSSYIYGGEVTGRGQTPNNTLATEFPALCAADPRKARRYIDGAISGAQYANHHLEGTVVDVSGAPILSDILQVSRERQLNGYKAGPKDWTSYFYPWWCKPTNTVTPDLVAEYARQGRRITPEVEDYFARLRDTETIYQMDRQVRRGGIPLSAEQKWWFYLTLINEKGGDLLRMAEDYPSLPDEGADTPQENKYCRAPLILARKEGRITNLVAQHGYPVFAATDWGWGDETVFTFYQIDATGFGHTLGGFAVRHWTIDKIIERLEDYHWREKTGLNPIIDLPHDTTHKNSGSGRRILGGEGESIEEHLNARGYETRVWSKPANKMHSIAIVREQFPRIRFDEEGTKELRDALFHIHVETISVDGRQGRRLKDTPYNHWHDSFEILCRRVQETFARVSNPAKDAQIRQFYATRHKTGGLNSPRRGAFGAPRRPSTRGGRRRF